MNNESTIQWPPHPAWRSLLYVSFFIIVSSAILLFYYAWLIPIHVDEAGYWFNFTNKAFANRFVPNQQFPNHGLTIYFAKLSLDWFGYNGIGLRFPVIFFGILSWSVYYCWIKHLSRSVPFSLIAVCLLCLHPFFQHYSHELRGYPSYFFFIVCIYRILSKFENKPLNLNDWLLLGVLFAGCYLSNLASPLFYASLLSSLWILFFLRRFKICEERLQGIRHLNGVHFFIFSAVMTLSVSGVIFLIDRDVVLRSMSVHAGFATNWKAIPDFFSTFLGYRYLDDASSEIARFPLPVWLASITAFFFGWLSLLRRNHFFAQLFTLLIIDAALFYGFSGKQAPLRSSIFLLPLILGIQCYGSIKLGEKIFELKGKALSAKLRYAIISLLILLLFAILHSNKLSRLSFEKGNAYSKAKEFMLKNISANDLIISSLKDTVGGFYFGEMIRKQTRSIFHNDRLADVYFLSSEKNPSMIALAPTNISRKAEAISLTGFEKAASFENSGQRPSSVHIFRKKADSSSFMKMSAEKLAEQEYFGSEAKQCKKEFSDEGLRLTCSMNGFACINRIFPLKRKGKGQFVIFHHLNDRGRRTVSFSALKGAERHPKTGIVGLGYGFFSGIFLVNSLIDNIEDLDTFRENIDLYDLNYQKIENDENGLLMCMAGNLFNGDTSMKGIKVFPVPF